MPNGRRARDTHERGTIVTAQDVVMLGIAIMGGAAGVLVVTARNVVHSALWLVIALLSVAGTFVVLGAEFLAWAQVLVYVGAVVVLILFGLMLTRAPIGSTAQGNELGRLLPVTVSGGLFVFLMATLWISYGDVTMALTPTLTTELGTVLYTHWAFPFMVIGFFLTVALIGAVTIARREEGEGPLPEELEPLDAEGAERGRQPLEPVPTDTTSDPTPVSRA